MYVKYDGYLLRDYWLFVSFSNLMWQQRTRNVGEWWMEIMWSTRYDNQIGKYDCPQLYLFMSTIGGVELLASMASN